MSIIQKIKHPFAVIFFTIFVDMLGVGILIPVIPILLTDPTSSHYILPASMSVAQGYLLLGILTALYPFMQFLAAPILGELSDSLGRRKVLAVALSGTAISYILFAIGIVTRNIPLLFFSRALDGITGGNISVAQAAVADITPPQDRVKRFGMIGAAFGLGFILGPFLGGKLSDPSVVSWFNAATPFWFAAILSTLNVIGVLSMLPETRVLKERAKIVWSRSVRNILRAFGSPKLRGIFATSFLFQAGFTFYTTFSGVFMISRFGFNQSDIGNFFGFLGIIIVFSQTVIVRRVAKRFNERQALSVSLIAISVVISLYYFLTASWQLFVLGFFIAPFISITMANVGALVSKSASADIAKEKCWA